MKIISEKTVFYKYAFVFPFNLKVVDFCRDLKTTYGYKNLCFIEGSWRFNDLKIAVYIKRCYPQTEIAEEIKVDYNLAEFSINQEVIKTQNAIRIKNSADSDIKIKKIKGELYPYQRIGVEFFANSNGRAILADQMGTGKTVQSLAYLLYVGKKKTLVVCPASVKHAWENEILKWTNFKYKILNSKSKKQELMDENIQIFVLNYDIVIKFYDAIITAGFDCLILDEFTYIKNSIAKRTKIVKFIAQKIPSLLLLSGTPILSRPVELFNGLNLIDSYTWGSYYDYTKKYCQGHQGFFGWDARGASNLDELQERIGKYFLRRTKEQVLPELPEKIFTKLPIELDKTTQKKYEMAINEFGKFLHLVKKKKTPEIIKSLQAEKLVKLGELRQLTTAGKVSAAKDVIRETLDNGEKILVFSCYNQPLEDLYEEFHDQAVLLIGKTPEEERKAIINKFQTDSRIKIFFGGTKSAGMGITLTAASTVLFIDYSWCPADHSQAMDRCHRPGQVANKINVYYLYALDTIDEYMTKLLERKQLLFNKLIEGANEGAPLGGQSIINNVLRMIERKTDKTNKTYALLPEDDN